jgi:transcriptional regulator with XRE-family HTH domain
MPRARPEDGEPTFTPNQVVASNLTRLRHRRGLTQAEVARLLSGVAAKEWSEAMVAHAERSVTGNRIREFTADDLVALARAFDVPVLYFLTPPPSGIYVHVPGSRIDTMTMLEAVLGRLDNLSEWERLLDEWNFREDEEVPFPLAAERRRKIRAVAGEIATVRAHHLIRRHFTGDLMQLRETLRSLADLVLDIEQHETLAALDEEEQIRRIEAMRADIAKGNRIAAADQQLAAEHIEAQPQARHEPAERKDASR